jgi:hypothetical protein
MTLNPLASSRHMERERRTIERRLINRSALAFSQAYAGCIAVASATSRVKESPFGSATSVSSPPVSIFRPTISKPFKDADLTGGTEILLERRL